MLQLLTLCPTVTLCHLLNGVGNPDRPLFSWLSLLHSVWGLRITQRARGWTVVARGCALRWRGHPHGHACLAGMMGGLSSVGLQPQSLAWQPQDVACTACLFDLNPGYLVSLPSMSLPPPPATYTHLRTIGERSPPPGPDSWGEMSRNWEPCLKPPWASEILSKRIVGKTGGSLGA